VLGTCAVLGSRWGLVRRYSKATPAFTSRNLAINQGRGWCHWTMMRSRDRLASHSIPRPRLALIVEHDTWLRTAGATLLEELRFEVVSASNGYTGVRLARTVRPDMVVLGSALPELTGDDVRDELCRLRIAQVISTADLLNPAGAIISLEAPITVALSVRRGSVQVSGLCMHAHHEYAVRPDRQRCVAGAKRCRGPRSRHDATRVVLRHPVAKAATLRPNV
jgi:CheY-like chemotaxis protein